MVFLHQPTHWSLFNPCDAPSTSYPITQAREALKRVPNKKSRPPWNLFLRSIRCLHRPHCRLRYSFRLFHHCRGPEARHSHGPRSRRSEPLRCRRYVIHVSHLRMLDVYHLLSDNLVPSRQGRYSHSFWRQHNPNGLGYGHHGHPGSILHTKDRVLRSSTIACPCFLCHRRRPTVDSHTKLEPQPLVRISGPFRLRTWLWLSDFHARSTDRFETCGRPPRHSYGLLHAAARRLHLPFC